MMTFRLTIALALGLILAGCSDGSPGAGDNEAPAAAATNAAPADADDDTLEPEAPKVEEGEEHNEDAPHSH